MKKKSQSVGRPAKPFPSRAALVEAIQHLVNVYNETPQNGRTLKGKSPNDALRGWIAEGWAPVVMDRDSLIGMCCRTHQAKTTAQSKINFKRRTYYHEALAKLPARTPVQIREPLFGDVERLAIFTADGRTLLCAVDPELEYRGIDGAGEAAQRRAARNGQLAQIARQADDVTADEVMALQKRHLPPAPTVAPAAVMSFSGAVSTAGRALAEPAQDRHPKHDPKLERLRRKSRESGYARRAQS